MNAKFRCDCIPLTFNPLPLGWRFLYAQRDDATGAFSREEVDILGVAILEEFYCRGDEDLDIGGEDKPAGRFFAYVVNGDGAPQVADEFFECENIEQVGVLKPGEFAAAYSEKSFAEACASIDKRLAETKQTRDARRNRSNPFAAKQPDMVPEEVCS